MIELLHNLLGLGLQDTKLREHLFILQVAHHFHGQNRILGLSRSAGNQEELRARSANYSINTQEVYIGILPPSTVPTRRPCLRIPDKI
jgi:hypothetical protein